MAAAGKLAGPWSTSSNQGSANVARLLQEGCLLGSMINLGMLYAEAQQVILLRTLRLAGGGMLAQREMQLMTTEKVAAAYEAGFRLMLGASGDSIVRGYRRKVRANARRLRK